MPLFEAWDTPHSELVIGLVAPVGTESSIVRDELHDSLRAFGYTPMEIRVSDFLRDIEHGITLKDSPEDERLKSYMDAGDKVRGIVGEYIRATEGEDDNDAGGDALAFWVVAEIARLRKENPDLKKAFIVRSLKHPKEVRTFRRIYGDGFFLVGIYSPQEQRLEYLIRNKGIEKEKAIKLVERDYNEEDTPSHIAQQTRETFHIADAFVSIASTEEAKSQIRRTVDLLFGEPSITPSLDEFAMFQAFVAGLRSADLSRQVGAVIISQENDLVSIGANDVPAFGGGLYWAGENDQRDFIWGIDSNAKRRDQILSDIVTLFKKLQAENNAASTSTVKSLDAVLDNDEIKSESQTSDPGLPKLSGKISDTELFQRIKSGLKKSILLDITEFGRPVHAEMEAILSCARIGVSPRNGTLYCTTFPCHNCAKHIVAAGIRKVVYVEPYPKSKAEELHSDSIEIDGDGCQDKVSFVPFVGIGPRRFIDLFSMGLSSGYPLSRKKKNSIEKVDWKRDTAKIRIPLLRNSYLDREKVAQDIISQLFAEPVKTDTEVALEVERGEIENGNDRENRT